MSPAARAAAARGLVLPRVRQAKGRHGMVEHGRVGWPYTVQLGGPARYSWVTLHGTPEWPCTVHLGDPARYSAVGPPCTTRYGMARAIALHCTTEIVVEMYDGGLLVCEGLVFLVHYLFTPGIMCVCVC